jgi:hypothetical protein
MFLLEYPKHTKNQLIHPQLFFIYIFFVVEALNKNQMLIFPLILTNTFMLLAQKIIINYFKRYVLLNRNDFCIYFGLSGFRKNQTTNNQGIEPNCFSKNQKTEIFLLYY